jgi:K(+)-stimulated pyrophosphate-energized sodium pump
MNHNVRKQLNMAGMAREALPVLGIFILGWGLFQLTGSHGLSLLEQVFIGSVLSIAYISLRYAWWLKNYVLAKETNEELVEVWEAIRTGAISYLSRQLRSILPMIGILALAMFGSVWIVPPSHEAVAEFGSNALITVAVGRTIAFIVGAFFSLTVGQLGMRMAILANIRVASAAHKGFNESLSIAYYAGTVTGMLTDGLGLLGGTVIFIVFGTASPDALLGFGFGGTLIALFMRIGGGIYTKAADVGADLVGKVEKNIPEDDPRNAAVIADLVGDNVGDCAGMAADIFESYEVTIVSSLILGIALYTVTGSLVWIVYPLIVRGIGVLSSMLGTFTVPVWEKFPIRFLRAKDPEEAMFRSYEVSSFVTVSVSFIVAWLYAGDIRLAVMTGVGVGLAIAFNPITSYFTNYRKAPVRGIIEQTKTGPATTILEGLSVGMDSSVMAVLVIIASFVIAGMVYGAEGALYVLYAVALIGIGMLSHTGNNVAMDAYGPISDNANGIGEMVWSGRTDAQTVRARKVMAELDAVGNTTKAITKGIAIASAVIAAVSLFASYITDVGRVQAQLGQTLLSVIDVANLNGFIGLLLGVALPWMFSSSAIRAVSRAASMVVHEVRRQFHLPGVMEGTTKPDYSRVVGISTAAAQKELVPLAVMSVMTPIMVGVMFGVGALGAFLAGVIASGLMLAVFMSNTGGAWDNAKKAIEDEPITADTGKGSLRHSASVVGDTVGDPLKDTAGPALNPMIKVVNMAALIAGPILVQVTDGSRWLIVGIVLAVLVVAQVTKVALARRALKTAPVTGD